MNEVFLKTRELGEAIMRSEEYINVKKAEEVALKNAEAAEAMGMYLECRQKVEELLKEGDKDWAKIKQLSDEMDQHQARMNMVDDIIKLNHARDEFSKLINQVNSVLRFIVTGEMQSEEGGCTGSCATCGGGCSIN